jgi:hypothetical protein
MLRTDLLRGFADFLSAWGYSELDFQIHGGKLRETVVTTARAGKSDLGSQLSRTLPAHHQIRGSGCLVASCGWAGVRMMN